MLTKDLIRHSNRKGQIYPRFLDPNKTALLNLAESLIDLFEESIGEIRVEVASAVAEHIESANVPQVIAKGFEKLLLDRCTFEIPDEAEIISWRFKVLSLARQQLQDKPETLAHYHQQIAEHFDTGVDLLQQQLYGDLAENHTLAQFKKLSPARLIHKYNASQVQWLLLWAREIRLKLPKVKPEQLRQLTKYMRFRRLLAEITPTPGKKNSVHLTISGPLNIFHKSQRYGLNLALFFPAILHQDHWLLEADIELSARKKYHLKLDQSCDIKPDPEHYSAYIPDDFQKFQSAFQEKVSDWTLKANTTFLPLPGEAYCFPDYVFQHASGPEISIELFHPWHAHQVQARLEQLAEGMDVPLLLCVDRKLSKKPEMANILAESEYFQAWGMLFNDLPPARSTEKLLNKWLEQKT